MNIVVVGLGFGKSFVPIYRDHPAVRQVGICELDQRVLDSVGGELGIQRRYHSLDDVLADSSVDAIHLLTPVPLHAEQSCAVLDSGKHCACAVPMATDLSDLDRIIGSAKNSGKNYMLMETAVYSREFFFVKDLVARGDLGELTFLKGAYYQDLEGYYPDYWRAQPPMHYATHSLSPLIALLDDEVRKVSCFGSGLLKASIRLAGGNEFPLQTAIFKMSRSDVAIELSKSWFQMARSYQEAFSVYGDRMSFEWQQLEHEDPVLFELLPLKDGARGRGTKETRVKPPFRPDLLPESLANYAEGGHGGSHPHLVHEFVSSIVEARPPYSDAVRGAQWTAPGICADLSAKNDGEPVLVPPFRR